MKKYFTFVTVFFVLVCCLTSCGKSTYAREQEAKRESIYERGYDAGYDEGYQAGILEALDQIEFYVEDDLRDLDHDIRDEWGMSAEESVQILTNYADGEPTSEADLNKAIWAVWEYYRGVNEIANDIDEYWID